MQQTYCRLFHQFSPISLLQTLQVLSSAFGAYLNFQRQYADQSLFNYTSCPNLKFFCSTFKHISLPDRRYFHLMFCPGLAQILTGCGSNPANLSDHTTSLNYPPYQCGHGIRHKHQPLPAAAAASNSASSASVSRQHLLDIGLAVWRKP